MATCGRSPPSVHVPAVKSSAQSTDLPPLDSIPIPFEASITTELHTMKRLGSFAFALILTLPSLARADFVTTFEDVGLGPDSFNSNAGGGHFLVDGHGFNNFFDSTFN